MAYLFYLPTGADCFFQQSKFYNKMKFQTMTPRFLNRCMPYQLVFYFSTYVTKLHEKLVLKSISKTINHQISVMPYVVSNNSSA